jgi:hypothetical protein
MCSTTQSAMARCGRRATRSPSPHAARRSVRQQQTLSCQGGTGDAACAMHLPAPVIADRHIALASNLHRQAARSPAVFPDVPWPSAPRARTRQKYLPPPARHRSRGNPGSFIGLAGPRALSCPAPSTRIGRRLLKKGIATPDQATTAIWCSPAVPRTPSRLSGTPCAAGVAGEPQRKPRKPTSCAGEHGARCCSEHAKRPFCPSRGAAVCTWSGIWTDAIVKGTVTAA